MFEPLFKILGYEKRATLANWSPELAAIFGVAPSAAGVAVTAETALRSPTTLACCRVISETIGSLPAHLFRRGDDGSRERDTKHPAAALLSGDWAPWAGNTESRTALQLDAILYGYGYAEVLRAGGKPKKFHRLDPNATSIDWSGSEPVIKTRSNGQERRLDWRDVLVISTPGSAPGRPLCLISAAREAIGVDLVMAEHQSRLFANGARPSGLLKAGPTQVSKERLDFLRAQFTNYWNGAANAGKTLILENGFDFKEMQFSSVDAQFLELRKFAVQQIASAFKVPGTLVGDLDRATWRNVEELSTQFLQTTLMPWLSTWQAALTRVLLTPVERESFFVEFQIADLLRADLSARFAAYRNAAGGAWLTRNEVRALENRAPIDGGDELILQAGQGGPGDAPPQDDKQPSPLKAVA